MMNGQKDLPTNRTHVTTMDIMAHDKVSRHHQHHPTRENMRTYSFSVFKKPIEWISLPYSSKLLPDMFDTKEAVEEVSHISQLLALPVLQVTEGERETDSTSKSN